MVEASGLAGLPPKIVTNFAGLRVRLPPKPALIMPLVTALGKVKPTNPPYA